MSAGDTLVDFDGLFLQKGLSGKNGPDGMELKEGALPCQGAADLKAPRGFITGLIGES